VETIAQEVQAEEGTAQDSEATVDTSMSGELAFAQCDEYINVRTSADTDSEVVGKVYNNGSVTILGQVGDWYEVQSGNATGYVKAEYFATGEEAQQIAEEVAYNVATVYPEALTVRSEASEDSASIGTVYSSDELEVVAYDGDWMKVALGDDVYGYVSAYYVGYDTYYATAETLEEEQARLDQQWLDYLAEQEAQEAAAEQAYLDSLAAEQSYTDYSYTEEQAAADAAWEQAANEAQATADAQAEADAQYQEYLEAQAAADEATGQADEQAVIDAAAQAEAEYQEYLAAQAAADAQAQAEAEAQAQAQAAQAQAEAEAAAAAQAQAEAEAAAAAQATADAAAQQAAESSSTAQAAADAAYQTYLEAQATADAATQQADEQLVMDTAAAAQAAYQEFLTQQAAADAAAAGVTQVTDTYTEDTYTENATTDSTVTEDTYTDTTVEETYTETTTSSAGQAIVDFAVQFVGNPYVWGGTSLTNGADCSGFTQSVMANFGISIPRTAAAQSCSGTEVALSDIQAGDLLFYQGDSGIGHVSIYMGNGQVVHASNASTGIIISDYGYRTPVSARRYW
jgi:cell wall-associated NlpC family hydrolase